MCVDAEKNIYTEEKRYTVRKSRKQLNIVLNAWTKHMHEWQQWLKQITAIFVSMGDKLEKKRRVKTPNIDINLASENEKVRERETKRKRIKFISQSTDRRERESKSESERKNMNRMKVNGQDVALLWKQ